MTCWSRSVYPVWKGIAHCAVRRRTNERNQITERFVCKPPPNGRHTNRSPDMGIRASNSIPRARTLCRRMRERERESEHTTPFFPRLSPLSRHLVPRPRNLEASRTRQSARTATGTHPAYRYPCFYLGLLVRRHTQTTTRVVLRGGAPV